MINILSYVGMNLQSEVCLWCLLGLVRTIFDATLFKVNANLKQVWQMTMPMELSMPVQRVLRTMVSGIMLVQCFTVYVYLAAYIVLLYPVFLEERPTLVLPWLLLAAIRKLLCELTSLALGLGTCVLLGPARPPCIKFVVVKFSSIMPAFYMWMLVFSYYHALKVASAFKKFPAVLPSNDNDYGLELAVRRRRTKSLLGEEQLRKKLVANFYGERSSSITNEAYLHPVMEILARSVDASITETVDTEVMKPLTMSTTGWSDIGSYEDWFGSEVMIPRDTDRILEQIVLMLLRIGAYLKKDGLESIIDSQILSSAVPAIWHQRDNIDCATINADDTDTPPLVGSSKGNMASYLREYPQIFMKKQNPDIPQTECTIASLKTVHGHMESEEGNASKNKVRNATPKASNGSFDVNKVASNNKILTSDSKVKIEDTTDRLTLPLKSKQITIADGQKLKTLRNKQHDLESQSKDNVSDTFDKMQNNVENSKTLGEIDVKEPSYSKIKNESKEQSNMLTDSNIKKTIAVSEDSKKEFINGKILTNTETENSADSKTVKQDMNEYTENKISINAKIQDLSNAETSKQDNNNEFIQNKISMDAKTQSSIFSGILNENENAETNKNTLLKQDDITEFTKRKVSSYSVNDSEDSKKKTGGKNEESLDRLLVNKDEYKNSIESKISTIIQIQDPINSKSLNVDKSAEIGNNEFTQRKLIANVIAEFSKDKTMNEKKNTESVNDKLSQETNDEFTQSKILTIAATQNSAEIFEEVYKNESIQSDLMTIVKTQDTKSSRTVNIEKAESIDDKIIKQEFGQPNISQNIIVQNSKNNILMKEDSNTKSTHSKISTDLKDESMIYKNNNKELKHTSNGIKIQDSADNKTVNNDKNKKTPQRKIEADTKNRISSTSNISNKDKNKESIDGITKLLSDITNQGYTDGKISTTNTSSCNLNIQNSNDTENNETNSPDPLDKPKSG